MGHFIQVLFPNSIELEAEILNFDIVPAISFIAQLARPVCQRSFEGHAVSFACLLQKICEMESGRVSSSLKCFDRFKVIELPLIGHLKNAPGEGVPCLHTKHWSFRERPTK
jgi:hypothetical protein